MSRIRQLVSEAHRRSLWQVLAIYIAVSWVVFEVVQTVTEGLGLPTWFPAFAALLLLIGLPVVLATAFVQEGISPMRRHDPTLMPGAEAEVEASPREVIGARRLFTWPKAISGGVMAFALWGVIATAWLLFAGPGFLVKAGAAEFFSAREKVVVAELENETDQEALGLAVREAIITDLDQSEYVNTVSRTDMMEVLGRMRLADTTIVDERVALEIARRAGHPAVVAGSVTPLGSGFQLSARIIEVATGEVAVRVRETASDESEVVAAVERLTRLVRRHLGESLASVRRSQPLPDVTTSSLDALEFYARAQVYADIGDWEAAIPLWERAVALDTAFAAAYRCAEMDGSATTGICTGRHRPRHRPSSDEAATAGVSGRTRGRLVTGRVCES